MNHHQQSKDNLKSQRHIITKMEAPLRRHLGKDNSKRKHQEKKNHAAFIKWSRNYYGIGPS